MLHGFRPLATLAACLFLSFGLLACGGGDDGEGTTATTTETTTASAPSLSREEIIAQGDAICAEVNAAIGGLEATDVSPATKMSQRTDLYTGMVERLRGLDSEDPELTAVFSAGRDLVQAASEAEASAGEGDTEAAVAGETQVTAALSAFRAAASEYGFTECGGPPDVPVTIDPGADPGAETPSSEGGTAPVEPEPVEPAAPQGGANPGGAPPDAGDTGGGTAAGGGTAGSGGGGDAGSGSGGSSTGGFSPGG